MASYRSIVLGLFLITTRPTATEAAAQAGQAGAFLRQESGARGAALGGALTAVADDAGAISWNPAGLSRLVKPEVGATHVTLFEDTSYDFISAGLGTHWGGFAASYTRQSSGGFERRNGPNDAATGFSISQSAFMLGWGAALPLPKIGGFNWINNSSPLSLGLAVKTVRETIDQVSPSAGGADVGLLFQPGDHFMFGVSIQNLIAPEMTFVSQSVRYPRAVDISPALLLRLSPEWATLLTVKLSKIENESLAASGGVELGWRRYAALRLGYQQKGLSTGVGVRLGNSRFDYAALLHDLGVSHQVSFTQRFGQTKEELEETIRRGISALTREEGVRLGKAYLRKAESEITENKVPEALRDLEAASLLDPENRDIRERISHVSTQWDEALSREMERRKAMQARQEVETSQKLRQAEAESKIQQTLLLANSYLAQGLFRSAKLEVEKTGREYPDNAELRAFLDKLRQGLQKYSAAQEAEAERLSDSKDYTGALRVLENALRQDPDNAALSQKTVQLRAMMTQQVTPQTRKNIEQLYYRAVEQYLKGDYQSASKLADAVMKLDPGSESARNLKDKIDAALRYTK